MKDALKNWWVLLIKGIILILLSFYIFQHPVEALVGLALYIGIATLMTGFLLIFTSLSGPKDQNWGWRLAWGIMDVIFGYILIATPGITAAVLPFLVGFWIIYSGILMFVGAFPAKKEGDPTWWVNLLGGLLTIVIGYFITSNFLAGTVAITYWIGFGFLISGIFNTSLSFRMRKLNKAI